MIGPVGHDSFGGHLLANGGVDTSGIGHSTRSTGVETRCYRRSKVSSGTVIRVAASGALFNVPLDKEQTQLRRSRVLRSGESSEALLVVLTPLLAVTLAGYTLGLPLIGAATR